MERTKHLTVFMVLRGRDCGTAAVSGGRGWRRGSGTRPSWPTRALSRPAPSPPASAGPQPVDVRAGTRTFRVGSPPAAGPQLPACAGPAASAGGRLHELCAAAAATTTTTTKAMKIAKISGGGTSLRTRPVGSLDPSHCCIGVMADEKHAMALTLIRDRTQS